MVGLYLEDALPPNLTNGMEEYKDKYTPENTIQSIKEIYSKIFAQRIIELQAIAQQELNKTASAVPEAQNEK